MKGHTHCHAHTYLGMIRPHDQPPTEQKGNVEYASTYDEPKDTGGGDSQSEEEHVVLVKVAEEPKEGAPLAKDSKAENDTGDVYHFYVVDSLRVCVCVCVCVCV